MDGDGGHCPVRFELTALDEIEDHEGQVGAMEDRLLTVTITHRRGLVVQRLGDPDQVEEMFGAGKPLARRPAVAGG